MSSQPQRSSAASSPTGRSPRKTLMLRLPGASTLRDHSSSRSAARMRSAAPRFCVKWSRAPLKRSLSREGAPLGQCGRNLRLRPLHLVVRETEFCGQRLAGDFSRRMRENGRNSVRRPRHASLTDRNCEGFCRPGNRVGLPVLYGGGCRNRTDGHRSLASLQNEAARRGFSARNDLSQRMSKSLAGKPKALTINRYLPVSLRFHSLSSRSTAMVVTCSRALRRLQE